MEKHQENGENNFITSPSKIKSIKMPQTEPNNMVQSDSIKPKAPKAKKRKKPKDTTAPRQPLTGYIRYLNDRREAVRTANPAMSFVEITKILASEWTNLPVEKKQQYLDAAEQDRERYSKEYELYKQTDAYKQFTQQQTDKKVKETKDKELYEKVTLGNVNTPIFQPTLPKDPQDMDFGNFDIPIFTEEFLDHNKTRDGELRQLRKVNTDYEQQNASLTKHIDNMKSAITKLETEIMQQEKTNSSLQQHLDHLRTTLSTGFEGVKLPGIKDAATMQNIDVYMANLHSMLLENRSQDTKLLQTVRDVVAKLEFNG
ncbi:high mobility group protein 20A [Dendroctonus ponderosae]|uniref:high mobility group protein 20A n=2 Tax=Dendroctonus ponderosae TaxID=77166 RepID=UPI0020365711|nr:high mobility group protein 20A [Dendroctonus ponderosae]